MQVLGPDLYNGAAALLDAFRVQTGATYPLLLNGGLGGGDENLGGTSTYGQYDNYVVINKQGVIRYHAYDYWPHGNRYHLDELRGTIDSLVTNLTGVDGASSLEFRLGAAPNPFRETTTLELTNPWPNPVPARVTVHDLAGRRLATLWESAVASGRLAVTWDGRAESGRSMGPGVYLVQAEFGGRRLTRRLVHIP